MRDDPDADVAAIEALIQRQFESLQWTPARAADWQGFAGDFVPGAQLFPAARPVAPKTVPEFVSRMQGLSQTTLKSLGERFAGARILAYGNVAVALAVCELTENGVAATANLEALLLVKEGDAWRIAAQAWDTITPGKPASKQIGDLVG